ncbi:D-alanyl-D-alanine carboxypeptidase/D-alanyl-D-alanine-endopeptidase [Nonomuraea antimicrobica]
MEAELHPRRRGGPHLRPHHRRGPPGPRVPQPQGGRPAPVRRRRLRQAVGQAGHLGRQVRTPGQGPRGRRRAGQGRLGPLYALVEHTLTRSDNDLAEALIRHVAIKEGQEASFAGATKAVVEVLRRLGVTQDIALSDGSGLSIRNRISPEALARTLALASAANRPDLHAVATGMPIAGFSGTLGNGRRFTGSDSRDQVGLVRAKTGTLNNINTLAGMATTKDGRLVTFAFMADRVPVNAEPVLDRLAAIVARS